MAKRPRRVSEIYKLGRTQPTLDFVDVDVFTDTPVFISPRALAQLPSDWGDGCVALIHNFFETVLRHIQKGEHGAAERLLGTLREPNETHLGLSSGRSRGRALGEGSAHEVWDALSHSAAAKSGLLKDLEDTVLMVFGIGPDIVSDMTTNIIRGPLIEYTQQWCRFFGIPLQPGIDSGPLWDPSQRKWFSKYVELPMTAVGKLLLVPKVIVRRHMLYDLQEYYRHYIIEALRKEEIEAGGSLVYLLRDGTPKVNIKDLKEKYGTGKQTVVTETLKRPELLDEYKAEKEKEDYIPLGHDELSDIEDTESVDWDMLLKNVTSIPTGKADSAAYENAIEALLSALFYPDLTNPLPQHKIHDGRKRIDIRYTNMGLAGFFRWLGMNHPAPHVFVECKNYGKDVSNPELDQLVGRFSPSRGKVGILVCRSFENKQLFQKRCRDSAKDGHGFIIALDDDDLTELVRVRREDEYFQRWDLLKQRFDYLTD
jgi:hypothetical protein